MLRVVVFTAFVIAVIAGLVGGPPMLSGAYQGSASPAASPGPDGLCAPGMPTDAHTVDVRPSGPKDAVVTPAGEKESNNTLYLVVITLPPGHCMPYSAKGNQKDGGVVLMVQQGHLQFLWQPEPSSSGAPVVTYGDPAGSFGDVTPNQATDLYPGDWVTLNQRAQFSYKNVGSDTAILMKAVWADSPGGGCSGGCK